MSKPAAALEADALIGSVIELGRIVNVPTPHLDSLYAVVKLLGETLAREKGRLDRRTGLSRRTIWKIDMAAIQTLKELLAVGRGDAAAITAPGAQDLTFDAFRKLVADTIATLNGFGIGRNDRVAIVLPNGPEMATAFVAIASGATAAPLNPAYTRRRVRVLYERSRRQGARRRSRQQIAGDRGRAKKLGIAVLTLTPDAQRRRRRLHALGRSRRSRPPIPAMAESEDIALILHTSGTTSRPKIVPLSQRNVTLRRTISPTTLEFTADDRGLNIMPLFHIHGLIAGTPRAAVARRQRVLHAGLQRAQFFGWMDECKPTWYTAVPTMHQAILARAGHNKDVIARHPLRFLRSSSASMPPQVIGELEAAFNAPLIEAYGMTEAAHQMASNPLRGTRKPGSVGLPPGRRSHHGRGRPSARRRRDRRGRHPRRQCHARATRTTLRPTPRLSPTAGSAPATRA